MQLLQELKEWASQHISIDSDRAPSMYYITNTALGNEEKLTQIVFFRASMWVFALDDIYDGNYFNLEELRALTTFLAGNDTATPAFIFPGDKQALVSDLKVILQELLTLTSPILSGIERGYHYFMNAVTNTVNAMLTESSGKTAAAPDIASYLETGSASVGVHPIFFLTFCCMDHTFPAGNNYTWLDQLLKPFSEVIRLANDKRSYERELKEQKLNSIAIIQQSIAASDSYYQALEQVDIMIEARMQQQKQIVETATNELHGKFARCTLLVSEITRQFYAMRDFK